MRSFNVRILANNEAGTWTSWGEKIVAIKAFYAPVCDLNITLSPSKLTPQFAPYAPISGSADTYVVDPTWYQENVLPLAEGADMIIFVVPPTDHPNVITYMGLDVYQQGQPGRLTVFSDETSHTYVGSVDQGEAAVVVAEHEISHQFYAELAKTDNTHLYFYAGTPEKVLADFDFDETLLSDYQQLVIALKKKLGLLQARQIAPTPDLTPSQQQNSAPTATQDPKPSQTSFPAKITLWSALVSKEEGANPLNHNPGNLAFSTLTQSWGAVQGPAKSDGGYLAKFENDIAGLTALCNFLVLGCQDELLAFHAPEARTLAGFTKIYAGNPPQGYTDAIVQGMGGDPDVQISTFLS
jgi:hypothetical protein